MEDRALDGVRMERSGDRVEFAYSGPGAVHYELDGSVPDERSPAATGTIALKACRVEAERVIRIPTSLQWRPPLWGLPVAAVVRARACTDERLGPLVTRTFPLQEHSLPVVALTLDEAAFFDAEYGMYTLGHGIFRDEEPAVQAYMSDHKWWKYPGNFQFRGNEWERSAQMEWGIDQNGAAYIAPVRLRINGNNTRGFPQHALRVYLRSPAPFPFFGGPVARSYDAIILRTGGNDQDRSFFADVLQHRLCAELPFGTMADRPCVLYVNGAYWGIHHARERLDDEEMARRFGGRAKHYAILEDRLLIHRGRPEDLQAFKRFLTHVERWNADRTAFVDSVNAYLDVEGFFTYMAAQMILGNIDWPDQNVKYWKYTGPQRTSSGMHDGRWRFLMGDSDLGFGRNGGPTLNMFEHVNAHSGPVARLYRALLRNAGLREQFSTTVVGLLNGPLSSRTMMRTVDRTAAELRTEMPTHVARWRRPLTMRMWEGHVATMRTFAEMREASVRIQLAGEFQRP